MFHDYCFSHDISVITDHKMLVVIFKKDVVSLSHRLQRIIFCIHHYNIRILSKLGPQLFTADWISRHNHKIGKDEEIPVMDRSMNVMETCRNIPECMTAEDKKLATIDDEHIGMLSKYMLHGWLAIKEI